MTKLKWGVIGAGGIANRRTIPEGITKAKNAELVAIMDVNEARLKEISQKFGKVKYYLKEKDLLSDPDVQAVYIATPVCLHARQAVMAAEVRKHVFCEKQMAMNIKECLEMITACYESAGKKKTIGV